MENLWKKESNGAGAQYVDLFAFQLEENRKEELIEEFARLRTTSAGEKCNQSFREFQKRGDDFYRTQNWREAIDAYNKSLCFAEALENVSIVYFNRSLCFFHMNMFGKALADSEIAMISNLPTHLIPELKKHKKEYQELLEFSSDIPELAPKLSYEANDNHPCLASVIDIKYNEAFGRHLVATADIPVGKTILLAKGFATAITAEKQVHCHTCHRIEINFIPCKYCSDVMFCNEDCANHNNLHKMECRTCYHQIKDTRLKLIVQTILVAIDIFPNIESLIAFVAQATNGKGCDEVPKTSCDAPSQYEIFLQLTLSFKPKNIHRAHWAFKYIGLMPKVMGLFDTEAKQRFLKHLVLHHTMVIPKNVFGNQDQCTSEDIYDILSFANHSCAPNLEHFTAGHRYYYQTVRPIKQGDQVFISYLGDLVYQAASRRREYILKNWGFDCTCDKCKN